MNIPDYDIEIQPTVVEFPEGWNSTLDRFLSDENYSINQLIEEEYKIHREEIAKQFVRYLINRRRTI